MFVLMVVVFVLGYVAIAFEHPLKIDKAASALLIGVLTWTIYILYSKDLLSLGYSPSWEELQVSANQVLNYIAPTMSEDTFKTSDWQDMLVNANNVNHFVKHELAHHLIEISEILFFLLGAMTIVEIVDKHGGFKVITDRIKTTKKVKLLWILSLLTFFMSAALDNLTTTIVMVALIRKLIAVKKVRWFFASMVVLAANAGGAWSPIGDVTTIMLWIGGQVTAGSIIAHVILPSLVTMIVPMTIVSFTMKGTIERPVSNDSDNDIQTTEKQQKIMLTLGIASLLSVPIFKTITHLPPFMGMLLGLAFMWVVTELMHKKTPIETKRKLSVASILQNIDVPTVLFFLGILTAVASLQSAGHLAILAGSLKEDLGNIYAINLAIGVLSSIVDNVPLVAGAMGMYDIQSPEMLSALSSEELIFFKDLIVDGKFWQFLAYCAGTGGSILIIGSAAGVAAMGMEKIDFIWYLKNISLLAVIGYLAGAGTYYLQVLITG